MYELCIHVNFMFQSEIKIDYPFIFRKKTFFKIPSFGVFTQALGKYLGKYPKNIYLPTGYFYLPYMTNLETSFKDKIFNSYILSHNCLTDNQ